MTLACVRGAWPVRLRLDQGGTRRAIACTANAEGLLLDGSLDARHGDAVEVDIDLGSESVRVKARVLSTPSSAFLRFVKRDDAVARFLHASGLATASGRRDPAPT
jgi:hypothetical protein